MNADGPRNVQITRDSGALKWAGRTAGMDKVMRRSVFAMAAVVIAASSFPADGATGVDPTKPIRVTFSEALDPATVGRETFVVSSGSPVAGIVTYDAATFSAIFTPSAPLRSATQYLVTLAVIRDVTGVVMDGDFNIRFMTR